jgi:hypothetical protein
LFLKAFFIVEFMDTTLSVFFNLDRTYVLIVDRTEKGLILKYVNSTNNPVDLEMPESEHSLKGMEEIKEIIGEHKDSFSRVAVTLPAEYTFISQFPAKNALDKEQIKKLVNLELNQVFPESNMKHFSVNAYPFEKDKQGNFRMMAVIISKKVLESTKQMFEPFGMDIDNMEIAQLNAHSAFLYNYPETATDPVVFVNVQDKFLDISLIKDKKPCYYNLASYDSKESIGEVFENEYNKMIENNVEMIKSAFFFGSALTKDVNMMCWETGMMLGIETKRLNPFRMVRSQISDREKEYCARIFHLYPGPVGACIPPLHTKIKLA